MSILFALLAAVGWGTSDFAAGYASRRSSAVSVVILTYLASCLAFLALSMVPGQGGSPGQQDMIWGVASGLAGGVGAMFLFRGLGRGAMAVVAPVTATGAASIPALYGIVTGEPITVLGIVGIVVGLLAIVFVSLAPSDADHDDETSPTVDPAPGPTGLVPFAPTPERRLDPDPTTFTTAVTARLPIIEVVRAEPPRWQHVLVSAFPDAAPRQPRRVAVATARTVIPPPPVPPPASAVTDTAPSPASGGSGAPAAESAPASIAPSPSTPSDGRPNEIRMSLRKIRMTISLLVAATVLAIALAIRPTVVAAIEGEPLTAGTLGTLALAGAVAVLALVAVHQARLLFSAIGGSGAGAPGGRFTLVRQPGLGDALVSGVGFGFFYVFISRASEAAGHWPLVTARGVSVVLFVLAALVTRTALLPDRSGRSWVVAAGLLDAVAAASFVLATRHGLLSVGSVLASMYPVATILLARVVVKERVRRQQVVGLGLAGLAVGLLAFSSG